MAIKSDRADIASSLRQGIYGGTDDFL